MLGQAARRFRWRCLSYCLMPNHVHLLIETPRANLGVGISSLHGRFAMAFNHRHKLEGHVFQGRYGAKRLVTDAHLWVAVRYIARNPVDAGLCAAASDWPWSSHSAVEDGAVPPWLAHTRLLELMSGAGGDARDRYDELVRRES